MLEIPRSETRQVLKRQVSTSDHANHLSSTNRGKGVTKNGCGWDNDWVGITVRETHSVETDDCGIIHSHQNLWCLLFDMICVHEKCSHDRALMKIYIDKNLEGELIFTKKKTINNLSHLKF